MNDAIFVMATIDSNQDMVNQVKFALQQATKKVIKEPGCIHYLLHYNREKPTQFILYECWASQAHLESHSVAPAFIELSDSLKGKATLRIDFLKKI